MLVVSSKSNLGCEAGCGLRFCGRIMVGSFSDHARIILGSSPHWKWRFTGFWTFSLKFCRVIFRGRRSIWWGLMVTPVVPRIVNEVSYVMRTQNVSLLCDRRSIWWGLMVTPVAPRIVNEVWSACDEDEPGVSLFVPDAVLREVLVSLCVAGAVLGEGEVSRFVAGAVFGEGEVSLFVAGVVFGEGLNVRLAAKCCILQ